MLSGGEMDSIDFVSRQFGWPLRHCTVSLIDIVPPFIGVGPYTFRVRLSLCTFALYGAGPAKGEGLDPGLAPRDFAPC